MVLNILKATVLRELLDKLDSFFLRLRHFVLSLSCGQGDFVPICETVLYMLFFLSQRPEIGDLVRFLDSRILAEASGTPFDYDIHLRIAKLFRIGFKKLGVCGRAGNGQHAEQNGQPLRDLPRHKMSRMKSLTPNPTVRLFVDGAAKILSVEQMCYTIWYFIKKSR